MAFAPTGRLFASGGDDHTVRVWDAGTGRQIVALGARRNSVCCAALATDNRHLVAGYEDGSLRIWDVDSGSLVDSALSAHSASVKTLAISGRQTITVSGDGQMKAWEIPSLILRHEFELPDGSSVESVAISTDGNWAVSAGMCMRDGCGVGDVSVWDLATGRVRRQLKEWGDVPITSCGGWWKVDAMALSPDETILVTAVDHEVQLWNMATGEVTHRFTPGDDRVFDRVISFAFSADGATLAAGTVGYTIILWDVATGTMRKRFQTERDSIASLAFSPDGSTIAASTHYERIIWLHDAQTGELTGELTGHTNSVNCVLYANDGALTITGGKDGFIKVWKNGHVEKTMMPESSITA